MTRQHACRFYEFGPFRLDTVRRRLLRADAPVALSPKAFELLQALIAERGQVVEKDELMKRLWPDTIVEEANLTVHASALRKASNPWEIYDIIVKSTEAGRKLAS